MRIESRSGNHERKLIIAMIVDKIVLGAVAQKWEDRVGLFSSRWANLVGQWCTNYYRKFHKAPGKEVESLFDRWADTREGRDKDTVKLVEKFLSSLSREYVRLRKESQTDYMLDVAGSYFTRVRLTQLKEDIEQLLEDGDITKAEDRVNAFHRVEIGLGAGIDVLSDTEATKRAFLKKSKPVVTYSGAAGQFFGNSLERDGFISFEAPEKRGKTFLLMDVTWRAMLQGRQVAFFSVGDLSEEQAMRRFQARAAGIPIEPEPYHFPIALQPPTGNDDAQATTDLRKPKLPLDWKTGAKKVKALLAKHKRKETRHGPLQLFTYPNSSISILGIRSALEDYAREGWVPDVVIIDYADILAPINGAAETRDQVNATWKAMRRMSQELHCLVVTATQTDADSYDTEIIDMKNFSEDKRKRAHVTGSIGINQTDPEKQMGVMRLNWIVRREWPFSKKKCLHVAGCLALARPIVLSTF